MLTWQTKEYNYYPKGYVWKTVFFSLSLVTIIIFAFWLKNYPLTILTIISLAAFYISAHKKPKEITILINDQGIKVGQSFFPYKNIKSFWIFYQEKGDKELSLKIKALLIPDLRIPINHQDPIQLRHILLKYNIPEEKQVESLLDLILKIIRY